jgi:hypothetical protein
MTLDIYMRSLETCKSQRIRVMPLCSVPITFAYNIEKMTLTRIFTLYLHPALDDSKHVVVSSGYAVTGRFEADFRLPYLCPPYETHVFGHLHVAERVL